MRGSIRRLGAVFAVLALLGTACAQDDDQAGGEATPREASFDLKLGMLTTFTGDLSPFGEPIAEAGRIAVEIINETLEDMDLDGEIAVSIQAEDTQTDSTAGVEAATKLVTTDDVQVIVGALASDTTTPVAESVTIPNEVVQISPASTAPGLTDLEDDGYFWRTAPSDALQGAVIAEAMESAFGSDATVNTGARNDAYGTALKEVFEGAWEDLGGTIGESVDYNPDAATFDSEAEQLASGEPDAWMVVDFPETWAQMGPALVRTGNWDPGNTFTADGLRSDGLPEDVGEEATEGMRGTAPSTEGAAAADAFDEAFQERSSEDVDRQTFDAQAFDAVMVAFLAAVAGGSADSADIRDNLEAVSGPGGDAVTFEELEDAIQTLLDGGDINYEGASGPIDFDENGDPGGAFYEIWEYQDGELATLESFGPVGASDSDGDE